MNKVTVIIPPFDNTDMISALIARIDAIFENDKSRYEILFARGTNDRVSVEVKKFKHSFPVRLLTPHKHWAAVAKYDLIAIVNTNKIVDYPPEALPAMIDQLHKERATIMVGAKKNKSIYLALSFIKNCLFSLPCRYSYEELNQSGLIILQKSAYPHLDKLEMDSSALINALAPYGRHASHFTLPTPGIQTSLGYGVLTHYRATILSVLRKRIRQKDYLEFNEEQSAERGNGFYYKGKEYVTHNTLIRRSSAVERTTLLQKTALILLLGGSIILAALHGSTVIVAIASIVTLLYFCDLLFNLFLIYRSFKAYSEIAIDDSEVRLERSWPIYTILCPLYKEALVIPQFIAAMETIDYPKDRLEVLLLLEEDDIESINAVKSRDVPAYFKVMIVPHSMPKTKPKACNYGLLRAKGEYTVIYDAEDIPDPLQLKKAVVAFERSSERTECIQAKLNYYNWNQNLLTRLFTLEYSLWFNLILTGLQSIRAPIPLGGTSNHFRTRILRELGGWDPFNVTEDADLGMRLAKRGLKTAILDSTTLEEANSAFGNWLKQRSRWIKGYMQTYLVHTRDVREFGRNSNYLNMLTFQLIIGGKVLSMLINPILWIMTVGYFLFREQIGPAIEALYLTPIFYLGAISLIIGNFMYLYYYMMGAAREGRPELIIYALFVPVYWIMMSFAAYYALRDLVIRPFHWHKTRHGLHLKKEGEVVV